MSIKLHCRECGNDYDTILIIDEINDAVCPRCGSFGSSVLVTPPATPEQPQPVTKTEPVPAPVAPASPPAIPPSSPSRRSTRKLLLIAAGALIVIIVIGLAGYLALTRHRAPGVTGGTDIVIEKETPAPAPAAKAEEDPTKPLAPPPSLNVPAQKKVVKKAPVKEKAATATPQQPWRYRVEAPTAPAPKPQTQAPRGGNGNVVGKLFEKFTGPAPDVTPPAEPGDARGSGM